MKKLLVAAAAGALVSSIALVGAGVPAAFAQSANGEAASGGVAGGDSSGSQGSARGGDGPSDTGEAA